MSGRVERATRVELRGMGVKVTDSALAQAAVDLAGRLDAGPTDRDAAGLSRELRMLLDALHQRHDAQGGGELDAFLAGLREPAFRKPTD